ncbi:MAG: ABC transporter ATP-binding protein [Acidaminobacteraceae bacterium]
MDDNKKFDKKSSKDIPRFGGRRGLTMLAEKPKDFKRTTKRLLTYLRPRKNTLILVFVFAIMSNLFLIISPRLLGNATSLIYAAFLNRLDGGTFNLDYDYISKLLLMLVGLYVLGSIFTYMMQYIMASLAQRTIYQIRQEMSEKLTKLPLKYYDSKSYGEILSRITNDVDNIATTLQQSLTQFISSLVTIIGVLIMMLTINPVMTLVSLITIPVSILITKKVASKSQGYYKTRQKEIGNLNGHVEEMYTGHKIIKVFGHEKKSLEKFEEINNRLFESNFKAQFISGIIMPLMSLVGNLGYVFITVIGGVFMLRGIINIGDIQAFIQYSRKLNHPIMQFASIANIIQSTIASSERVFELLDEEEESFDISNASIKNVKGNIKFTNVEFGYSEDHVLMKNINMDVCCGDTIAIVGPTGAGKTTIVNLLMRFYEISSGTITIDDVNITDIPRGELRNYFGMVLQDTWLFNGTIRDNIKYGKLDASDEEVYAAAKMSHADHFIRSLPDGYDTILNEEANNISSGQNQLLTIARAILANPKVLILDEATSSVDTRTEILIQKAMNNLMEGRTSFVIAHRLSTIKDADTILVMNDGDIIEKGCHSELLKSGKFYAELYNSQFGYANK